MLQVFVSSLSRLVGHVNLPDICDQYTVIYLLMNINMKVNRNITKIVFSLSEHLIQEYTETGRSQSTNELGPKGFGGMAWGICTERWRHSDSPKIHPVWWEQNQGSTACHAYSWRVTLFFVLSGISPRCVYGTVTHALMITVYWCRLDEVTNGQTLFSSL